MAQGNSETKYTHGSNADFSGISSRTATSHAHFLLPHLKSGDKLLDIGCGPGSITLGLAEAVAPQQVIGVDIGQEFVDTAKANAKSAGTNNVEFAVGNALDLDFADDTFDVVFAFALLEHIPEPANALTEWKRVLKPGGIIAVGSSAVSKHVYPPDSPWGRVFDFYMTVWEQNGGHPDLGLVQPKLLEEAGFGELEIGGFFTRFDATGQVAFAERIREPSFKTQAIKGGFATAKQIEDIAKEMEAWARRDSSWYLMPWFYGLAKKSTANI